MAQIHGKSTVFKIGSDDLSTFCNSVEFKMSGDSHDTTTFGQTGHVYKGGLTDGTIAVKGIYDDGATTPKTILVPLLASSTTFTYRPEGTGSGKPESTGACVVTSYEESSEVAGMIAFSAEFQISGAVTAADQS